MPRAPLSIGLVLIPDFTMLAFAGFLDTLRLAADEGDRSRPIACRWTVMSEDGGSVRASNGVRVDPDGPLGDPSGFDYVAVIGGILHHEPCAGNRLNAWLVSAATGKTQLIGACTGSFVLARAGLMNGRRTCVSWFHKQDFQAEFPNLEVVADRLFVEDGCCITCAGGTSVIHLASALVERHLGSGHADKGLRIMLEEQARVASTPQPLPTLPQVGKVRSARLKSAVLMMERSLSSPMPIGAIASAVGMSERHLSRVFHSQLGQSPVRFRETLRIERARTLLLRSELPMTEIALRCGFSDAAHFSRRFRVIAGCTPASVRRDALRCLGTVPADTASAYDQRAYSVAAQPRHLRHPA